MTNYYFSHLWFFLNVNSEAGQKERNVKDKSLLTSGEIQGLIQPACISLQQCRITPTAFGWDWLVFKWTGMFCVLYSCPLQLSVGSIFNKKGSSCFRHTGNIPQLLNKNNYTNKLLSTFWFITPQSCCCDCSPCQWGVQGIPGSKEIVFC